MIWRISFVLLFATYALASKSVKQVVDNLFTRYEKSERPDYGGRPVDVVVEAAIFDVYNFDEISHQVTLTMVLRQKWVDRRLAYDYNEVNGTKVFLLDYEQAKKMWIPDTFIANERSVIKHDFSQPNEYTRVQYNGSVTRSVKLTVTVGCILNLRWYPFDQNVCSLNFESYAYTMNDVRYLWAKDYTGKAKIRISKETAQSVRHKITAFRGTDHQVVFSNSNYSRAGLELLFKRLSFRYLLDVYFPATAIPVVSFITLCVGPLHFRVMMSTICMFMMVTYAVVFRMSHVTVDYKTALDFYVFNSSVTVFNVVLVNFLIYYLLKPKPSPTQMRMRQLNGSSEDGKGILADEESAEDVTASTTAGSNTSSSNPRFPNKSMELLFKFIEKSYLTMPIFFIAFNVIYWPVVLIASSGTPEDFIFVEALGT